MAKKGDIARETAKNAIIAAFGDGFVGIQDKKIYVNVNDGADIVQLAISIAMPKTPIGGVETASAAEKNATTPTISMATELSSEDQDTVNKLMERLGLK